jgi:hypothetical protein
VDAPIFSRLRYETTEDYILFGTHASRVICIVNSRCWIDKNAITWNEWLVESAVFATPLRSTSGIILAFDVDGTLYSMKKNEQAQCLVKLGGSVFSSPVLVDDNRLVVGCRDDWLYMLPFNTSK